MIYNIKDYNVQFEIPTDNFYVTKFISHHTQYMWDFIPEMLSHISNHNQLIVLFGAFENLHEYDHWFQPLNDFVDAHSNPLVVFSGRLTSDPHVTVQPRFNYHKINIFDHVSNINCNQSAIKPDQLVHADRSRKFYWASTKDYYPRRYLLANLIENNLIDNNFVNYKCLYSHIPGDYCRVRMSQELAEFIEIKCDSIADHVPLPSLDNTIEFNLTDKKFYNDTYLGIITDTFYSDHGMKTQLFLSEKIYQAINHHQLFFYIGPPYTLDYLEQQGYCVFRGVFDTAYDRIEDNGKRLIEATKSLLDFLNLPLHKVAQIYKSHAKEIYHNKILLQSQRKDLEILNVLSKVLHEH
jgi:hypothetical protein